MPRRCDIWRIGVVDRPIETIARDGLTADMPIRWLAAPGPSFTFDADPFGLWRDGRMHLFVEAYDYRTRHGVIDHVELDALHRPVSRATVLREPWHLSYPFVFEAEGATWLLPEAYRSGGLTLYRAARFPDRWEPVCRIALDSPAIDPTPLFHDDRWWLFYSASTDRAHRLGSLCAAWADRIEGPWTVIGNGPLRLDLSGARPGGRPFLIDGGIVLPVQDCSRTYGGAIRLLHLDRIDRGGIAVCPGRVIAPLERWKSWNEGLHTLSACGAVTLIDAKRIDRTGRGWLIDAARRLRRVR